MKYFIIMLPNWSKKVSNIENSISCLDKLSALPIETVIWLKRKHYSNVIVTRYFGGKTPKPLDPQFMCNTRSQTQYWFCFHMMFIIKKVFLKGKPPTKRVYILSSCWRQHNFLLYWTSSTWSPHSATKTKRFSTKYHWRQHYTH